MKFSAFAFILILFLSSNSAWSDNGSGGAGNPKEVPQYISYLVESGQYAAANKKLKYFVRRESDNIDGWSLLAYSQLKAGDFKASMRSHKKALKLDRTHLAANHSLGELFVALGDTQGAARQLDILANSCGECAEYLSLQSAIRAVNS